MDRIDDSPPSVYRCGEGRVVGIAIEAYVDEHLEATARAWASRTREHGIAKDHPLVLKSAHPSCSALTLRPTRRARSLNERRAFSCSNPRIWSSMASTLQL